MKANEISRHKKIFVFLMTDDDDGDGKKKLVKSHLSKVLMSLQEDQPPLTSFLTLGDGDFTYSLDLARYLASKKNSDDKRPTTFTLTASGIDTKEQLFAKYKDANFIMQSLSETNSSHLSISICHGVNAIVSTREDVSLPPIADHVLFHHPHVGTENSALHARFLSHLFHAISNFWLKPGGVFHLTLVTGQYERWKCEDAASCHGFVLLSKVRFQTPPTNTKSTYHYRRHQTGKSFESRRPDRVSETYTFGRKQTEESVGHIATCLPWQCTFTNTTASPSCHKDDPQIQIALMLPCPYCEKSFREERSRKCHMRAVHPNGSDKKQKSTIIFSCSDCDRSFSSQAGLDDHARAKHAAIHQQISPDWHQREEAPTTPVGMLGSCDICGLVYKDETHQKRHAREFIPKEASSDYNCQFCKRSFRELRAARQHENFCKRKHLGA